MKKTILIILLITIPVSILNAALNGNIVEARGRVYKFDEEFVYLKTHENKITVVPRKIVSNNEINSTKEIHVFMNANEFQEMKQIYCKRVKKK